MVGAGKWLGSAGGLAAAALLSAVGATAVEKTVTVTVKAPEDAGSAGP